MFTGIIEEVGEVVGVRAGELRVRAEQVLRQTKPRDSIAVDGVDLTVTAIGKRTVRFGVMPETYRKTTLGLVREGRQVNLERAVRAADRAAMSCAGSSKASAGSASVAPGRRRDRDHLLGPGAHS